MSFVITYGRKFGIPLMLILPLLIIIFLLASNFNPDDDLKFIIIPLWFLLFLNSITVSISGYSLASNFKKEVERLHDKGFPIKSTEGFASMYKKIRNVFASALFISIIVFISFVTYLIIIWFNEFIKGTELINPLLYESLSSFKEDLRFLIMIVALSLIFIAIGISLLISMPDAPALKPGALMKYYSPVAIPSQLDNFISDSVFPFLDPITRSRWDEFSEYIKSNLSPDFEPNEDVNTKLEIAREKILLFAYLNYTMPQTVSVESTKKELAELFTSPTTVDKLMEGEKSGISWEILMYIIERVDKKAPEIFQVVDRIIVQLTENLTAFKEKNLFVSVTAPSTVSGNRFPFRILVFMLNKDKNFSDKKRPIQVKLVSDQVGKFPDSYELHLDEAEVEINADSLPFIGEGEDVVGILSRILQVGDAIWFQEFRKDFNIHLFNIRVAEEGKGSLYGISINIKLVRDLKFYLAQYGGKISALAGAALPIIGLLGIGLT